MDVGKVLRCRFKELEKPNGSHLKTLLPLSPTSVLQPHHLLLAGNVFSLCIPFLPSPTPIKAFPTSLLPHARGKSIVSQPEPVSFAKAPAVLLVPEPWEPSWSQQTHCQQRCF